MGFSGNDNGPVPVRATYFNLYKWPESDAKFIKSIIIPDVGDGSNGRSSLMYGGPRVEDGFSRRQLYLRSYTFSRKEDYKAIKCLERIKGKIRTGLRGDGRRKAADSIFRRLLSCTINIDVVD